MQTGIIFHIITIALEEAISVGPLTILLGDHLEKAWTGLQLMTQARPSLSGK